MTGSTLPPSGSDRPGRRTGVRGVRDVPALRWSAWPPAVLRGASRRSLRRSRGSSRTEPSSTRFSASSILRINLRSRSRVRSSRLNSSSCVARSFGSGKLAASSFMCETVRSTSSMRSRFQPFRMFLKCSSCTAFMYCSPRLAMYGVTFRGPASRLPASVVVTFSVGRIGASAGGEAALRRRHAGGGHHDAFGRRRLANRLCHGSGADEVRVSRPAPALPSEKASRRRELWRARLF